MKEKIYIQKKIRRSKLQSILFYLCRIFPVKKKKIVFCCIEGTTGYSCNPKYIAEELIQRRKKYELVWLVNDTSKVFPKEIKAVRNSLLRRAYHLSTAHFWIDNSRKQLEVRKRKGQIYIQTWHAKLGFKPTCLDRGASFSRIAYLISKHDSDMIDYIVSNSKWYDDTLSTGMLYEGAILRVGSPRCDILINDRDECRSKVRKKYHLPEEVKILMYAPTFRGGSQDTEREIGISHCFPDYKKLIMALDEKFGGKWYIFLRMHPQLVARKLYKFGVKEGVVDVSEIDDMYELLAGCDGFMTDYSSAAFDAMVMRIPVFLYGEDYIEYQKERGKLLWDLRKLPFPFALNQEELLNNIGSFDEMTYQKKLDKLLIETEMVEDGKAAARLADIIEEWTEGKGNTS